MCSERKLSEYSKYALRIGVRYDALYSYSPEEGLNECVSAKGRWIYIVK